MYETLALRATSCWVAIGSLLDHPSIPAITAFRKAESNLLGAPKKRLTEANRRFYISPNVSAHILHPAIPAAPQPWTPSESECHDGLEWNLVDIWISLGIIVSITDETI
jgi:hypothetical protein